MKCFPSKIINNNYFYWPKFCIIYNDVLFSHSYLKTNGLLISVIR